VNNKNPRQLIAVVDDDRSIQSALKDLLESVGLVSECYGSAEEFLRSEQLNQTACLVLDIRMPGMSGLDLQARLKTEGHRIPIIFITARGDTQTKTQAMKAGALEFLSKPFDDEVLLQRVRAALKA
jgi:FixJ family two-component response regulator